MGCTLRMTNERATVFVQAVLGIIVLYCGYPGIIWEIMTLMRLINPKRDIKACAVNIGTRLRKLQPGESKRIAIAVAESTSTTKRTTSRRAWIF